MNNQNNTQTKSRTTLASKNSSQKARQIPIKLLSRDGSTKPTSAWVSKKSVPMTKCSDPTRGVHSASYGSVSDNSGRLISITFPEAQVLFARMQQDISVSSLFSSSM